MTPIRRKDAVRERLHEAIPNWLNRYKEFADTCPLHMTRRSPSDPYAEETELTVGQVRAVFRDTAGSDPGDLPVGLWVAIWPTIANLKCDECGADSNHVVRFGPDDWDVCEDCLAKATRMFDGETTS